MAAVSFGMRTTTQPITFKFMEKQDNAHIDCDGYLHPVTLGWFKIIETGHSKKGLGFFIPLDFPSYSSDIESELKGLESGDVIKMSLESVNQRNTAWICSSLES